ncbi:MAG TPA: peptidylprolyl isomerase [Pseudomonadales bacterium]|nr:peptidylprolyl isomerase [Pseudomonadales bacterium]
MQIADDRVVSIHYTLTNDAGETIDSSAGGDPLAYLHGHGNLIDGLESQLRGRVAGDKLDVRVAPRDGYGETDPALVQQVPRSAFGDVSDLRVGMRFQTQSPRGGPQVVVVTAVADDVVHVDGNHPLAGQYLNFAVEVTEVRAASKEELQHGHVHGAGGHHH